MLLYIIASSLFLMPFGLASGSSDSRGNGAVTSTMPVSDQGSQVETLIMPVSKPKQKEMQHKPHLFDIKQNLNLKN